VLAGLSLAAIHCGDERRRGDDDDDGGVGGAGASSGAGASGASSGSGGASGWDDLRCIEVGLESPVCYGALGDHWAYVYPPCTVEQFGADSGWQAIDPATALCEGAGDTSGWSDVACFEYALEGEDPLV
jgi:hypothetical protein